MRMGVMLALFFFFACPVMGEGAALSPTQQDLALEPNAIKVVLARVADWQLAHPSRHATTDWTHGTFLLAGSEVYKMALGYQVASEYHLLMDS